MALTLASISALLPATLNLGAVSAGKQATSAGKSHSWLRPTSQSRRPSAHTISVALAMRLTTRFVRCIGDLRLVHRFPVRGGDAPLAASACLPTPGKAGGPAQGACPCTARSLG